MLDWPEILGGKEYRVQAARHVGDIQVHNVGGHGPRLHSPRIAYALAEQLNLLRIDCRVSGIFRRVAAGETERYSRSISPQFVIDKVDKCRKPMMHDDMVRMRIGRKGSSAE